MKKTIDEMWASIVAVFAVLTCLNSASVLAGDKLIVYTVNYPLAYFAERIGGDQVDVHFPAPPDVDPAFWAPSAAQIGAYQRADLILLNGAGYAKWVNRVSLPRLKLVDTSAAFRDQYIDTEMGVTHSHGPGGDHSHAGTAFTTWLDFAQAAQQAEAVAAALSRKRPESSAEFEQRFTELERELLALDRRMRALGDSARHQPLLASHPVYQYLQRGYGLSIRSLMWEPEVVPDENQWSELQSVLRSHPARWMIWEGPPADESAERLTVLGVSSVVFAPAANRPAQGDFMNTMEGNLRALEAALKTNDSP